MPDPFFSLVSLARTRCFLTILFFYGITQIHHAVGWYNSREIDTQTEGNAKFSIHVLLVYLPRVSARCIIVITWQLAFRFVVSEFSS